MPRGRLSTKLPANDATRTSGRVTRSNSSRDMGERLVTEDELSSPVMPNSADPAQKRGRGRPRKSLLSGVSPAPSNSSRAASVRGSGKLQNSITVGSESISSVPTTMDTASDSEPSTPATSKMPTPFASDLSLASKPKTTLEIRLPSRPSGSGLAKDRAKSTRKSIFSMKGNRLKTEVGDSEEDDELSDTSQGAKAARRLQAEENVKGDSQGSYGGTRDPITSTFNSRRASKRGQSSTALAAPSGRPSKKRKIIPDSDDLDMDAEIAAGAVYSSGDSLSDAQSVDEVEFADSEEDEDFNNESSDFTDLPFAPDDAPALEQEDDDEDLPLAQHAHASTRKPRPIKARAASMRAKRTIKRRSTATDSKDATGAHTDLDAATEAMDSDEELYEATTTESGLSSVPTSDSEQNPVANTDNGSRSMRRIAEQRRAFRAPANSRREKRERDRLELHHPEVKTMWTKLESMPILKAGRAQQPSTISRQLKPFQLEGLAWMKEMEKHEWRGGLLGDEMGLGKTIQAVSLIMSDYPAKQPTLVLVPPVALMQWQSEIKSYTDGTLKTFVFHGSNQKTKGMTVKDLKKYDVIMMSYNSLESMYRKQEKGFTRKDGIYKEKSLIHAIQFHRAILDEAHSIKTRTTMTAKACFALKTDYRWCLSGTPLQNRIGEFFSLIRFLNIAPFASYLCKQCPCSTLEWSMNSDSRCSGCGHAGMQHVSVFNQELLNPIQKYGNFGAGKEAFRKLRLMTDRMMLRRLKKDHTNAMELPVKEIYVDRQFFGEVENDFANSIMTSGQRKFDTYVAQGVLLNNYANIFGLIMQMRQVADHPDLILKKNAEGGQNVLICCICDEPAEDTIRSRCKHDFCRACVSSYVHSTDEPDCPRCHIALSIDLEQPTIEQDENVVKKNSIINRIKMENWTSSSKIELLVHELHKLRSDNASHKSIIFSQFTTMLQLIEWRLRRAGITTVMLDGSMTPAQRQASIEHFMNNVNVECFLVSLKAGGVALNLTEASRVFIVDPWWNPAAEWQSADRCHRIGQTRPCTITRLCIEDSVESRMVLIQEKKTNMINSTVNSDDKGLESLSPEDMQFLFRGA